MRICLVCNGYPPENGGGIGTYTYSLANALHDAGHDVTVITTSKHSEVTGTDADSIHVIRVKVKYIPVLEKVVPGISWSLQLWLLLKKLQKKAPYDVIEFPNWEAPGVMYQLFQSTPKVVVRVHTPYFETLQLDKGTNLSFADRMICALEKYSCLKAHSLVSSTKAHAGTISKEYNLPVDRFTILPLGVKDCFSAEDKLSKYPDDANFRIVYISRLENRKGTLLLLEALPQILEKNKNILIDIIGQDRPHAPDGIYFKDYFNQNYKRFSSQVRFHGQLETQLCRDYLYKADLFVVPSLYESFGLIYPEAMMFGLPCISTRGGGIPEVITEGETGLLLSENTPAQLAEKVLELFSDKDQLLQMSLNARNSYTQRFTERIMVKNTLENYQNTINPG